MVRSINWPHLAQRALLEWIDDHKGPQSPLIRNYKQAIAELTVSLQTQFQDNASFSKGLSSTQIEQRINYLWKDKLGDFQSSALDVFYRDGTLTLDWEKLSHKPIARAFTKDEIASFKGQSVQSTAAGTDRLRATDDEQPTRTDKRRRTENGSENRSDSKGEQQEERRRKSPSKDPRKESDSQVNRSHSHQSSRIIGSTTFGNHATPTVRMDSLAPTQEVESATSIPEREHQYKSPVGKSASFALPPPRLPVVDNRDAEGGLFDLNFAGLFRYRTLNSTPTKNIESAMELLEHQITSAVVIYTEALGIPGNQLMIFDRSLQYPDECRLLFQRILGLRSFRDSDRYSEKFLAFQRTKPALTDFLQSFIGAAVSDWCLRASARPEVYLGELGGGTVKTVINDAFTPVIQAEIRQRLWEQHLSDHVVHTIDSEADHLASMLLVYIDILIPDDSDKRRPSRDNKVCRLPLDDPTKESSQPTSNPSPLFREPEERTTFRRSLVSIFKAGLKCHLNMSKLVNEDYLTIWPQFGQPYESEKNRLRGAPDADESKERLVRLGFMPLIMRRSLLHVDDTEWSEFMVVSKASVIPL